MAANECCVWVGTSWNRSVILIETLRRVSERTQYVLMCGRIHFNLVSSVAKRYLTIKKLKPPLNSESEKITVTPTTKAISAYFNILLFPSQSKISSI